MERRLLEGGQAGPYRGQNDNQVSANFKLSHHAACRTLSVPIGAAVFGATTLQARADDWPTRTVTVVVPYAPGGNTDMMARLASQYLSEKLGQSFVVENRAGGGGSLGAVQVAHAPPDGYTFLFGASTQIINIPLMEKVSYDPEKDFAPVSIFGAGPYLLGVKSSLPVSTLQELVDYAKARPGKLNYSTAGAGGSLHPPTTQMFLSRAGLDMVAIPYKGGAPAMAALVAGDVDVYFGNASELMAQGDNDRIKILAVSTPKRLEQLPNVPTVAETFPGYDTSSWNGFFCTDRDTEIDRRPGGSRDNCGEPGQGNPGAPSSARHPAVGQHARGVRQGNRDLARGQCPGPERRGHLDVEITAGRKPRRDALIPGGRPSAACRDRR